MEIPKEILQGTSVKKSLSVKVNDSSIETPSEERLFFKSKKPLENGAAYGTGKRKNSIARVWLKPGNGKVLINDREFDNYFPREFYRTFITAPFVETNTTGQYDIICTVKGGGTTGQAGAIRHGVAKALDCLSENFHSILRQLGFLTRDSRIVERKKYGRRKARRKRQFSKR